MTFQHADRLRRELMNADSSDAAVAVLLISEPYLRVELRRRTTFGLCLLQLLPGRVELCRPMPEDASEVGFREFAVPDRACG